MRYILVVVLLFSFEVNAQTGFEKGYFIDNNDIKTECLINNRDWLSTPDDFRYKLSEDSEILETSINFVRSFRIYDTEHYYQRFNVMMDKSANVSSIDTENLPVKLTLKKKFLKVLIEGEASLYEYSKGSPIFFYNIKGSDVTQLVYKKYVDAKNLTRENTEFRKELFDNLKCNSFTFERFLNIDYLKDELTDLFEDYNQCVNSEYSNFQTNLTKSVFSINANVGFTSSSVNSSYYFSSSGERYDGEVDFDNQINLLVGLEFETKLAFNRNKWAFFVAPSYQSYKETTKEAFLREQYIGDLTVKFSYLEIPFGVRHYMYLSNNRANISISVAYAPVIFFDKNESYMFRQDEGFIFAPGFGEQKRVNTSTILFGVGYDFNEKTGIKLNFYPRRKITSNEDFISNMNGLMTLMASYKLL